MKLKMGRCEAREVHFDVIALYQKRCMTHFLSLLNWRNPFTIFVVLVSGLIETDCNEIKRKNPVHGYLRII